MRLQHILKIFLILILCNFRLISAFAEVNLNNYNNGNAIPSTASSKQINYINNKNSSVGGLTFCIDKDKINYNETFLDEERDYFNLAFSEHLKPNGSIPEIQKRLKDGSIYFKYTHTPTIYDSPVTVSSLSGNWYPANIAWNADKGKWLISDTNDLLFTDPTDFMRGEWVLELKGKDATGKDIFDKETIGVANFKVHKAPIPKFNFSEGSTYATLSDAGSYDVDYQYQKNSHKNSPEDREYSGIKEFYWSAKIGDNWVDVGKGSSVTFNKQGKQVSDYMLTVLDYDGAYSSISKTALILDKPSVDFETIVGGKLTPYVYEGNSGHETLTVNPLITWNDDAFSNPPYTTSGTRTTKWTALATTDWKNDTTSFNELIKTKFKQITRVNKTIPIELEAKNKYDYFSVKEKSVNVIYTDSKDNTGTEGIINCKYCDPVFAPHKAFLVGTNVKFILDITNEKVNINDVVVKVSAPSINITNLELNPTNGSKFEATSKLNDPDRYNINFWNQFNYTFSIYSKRTNELLHVVNGTALIHTPLEPQGTINNQNGANIEVNTDDIVAVGAETKKYAEKVTVAFPIDSVDPISKKIIPSGDKIELTPTDATHTKWKANVIFSSDPIDDDTKISAKIEAVAFNKRDKETIDLGFLIVSYRLENFRVTKVRDLNLEGYYKSSSGYNDIEMDVNYMAIDPASFSPFFINSLTKGYLFEFKIDSINFNESADTIIFTPSFYSIVGNYRDPQPKYGYWIDSNKKVWKAGQGGHSQYGTIILTKDNRTITDKNKATWSGKYLVPGTFFLTSPNTTAINATANNLKSDIIVNFNIEGYKNGIAKFNYNNKRWGRERTVSKTPYVIGDVIRYGKKSNLDDINVMRVRP